jgi:uncharacterized membrane protein YqgA involved in biofilm formation
MTGTILNCITILLGSLIGVSIGNRLPETMRDSIMNGLGLVTLVVGMQNAFKTGNILLPLLGLLIGTIIGESLNIDGQLKRFGAWLQSKVERDPNQNSDAAAISRTRFINGFVTASLVFCVGPMAILGSIQNGLNTNDIQLLAIKSTLDFFASIAFAATLGIGVAFSIIPTVILQGGFSLVGVLLGGLLTAGSAALSANNPYLRELTGVGGIMLMGISLILLNLKPVRVANFLPGLIATPLLVLLATLLGINIYP